MIRLRPDGQLPRLDRLRNEDILVEPGRWDAAAEIAPDAPAVPDAARLVPAADVIIDPVDPQPEDQADV